MLTDSQVKALVYELKPTPAGLQKKLLPRPVRNHIYLRRDIEIVSESGRKFVVYTSQKPNAPMHFSVGLTYLIPGHNKRSPLVRCNGWHSEHTNKLEQRTQAGVLIVPRNTCHIHWLTERYQVYEPENMDGYAEPTNEYHSLEQALEFFVETFGFYEKRSRRRGLYPLFHQGSRQ